MLINKILPNYNKIYFFKNNLIDRNIYICRNFKSFNYTNAIKLAIYYDIKKINEMDEDIINNYISEDIINKYKINFYSYKNPSTYSPKSNFINYKYNNEIMYSVLLQM